MTGRDEGSPLEREGHCVYIKWNIETGEGKKYGVEKVEAVGIIVNSINQYLDLRYVEGKIHPSDHPVVIQRLATDGTLSGPFSSPQRFYNYYGVNTNGKHVVRCRGTEWSEFSIALLGTSDKTFLRDTLTDGDAFVGLKLQQDRIWGTIFRWSNIECGQSGDDADYIMPAYFDLHTGKIVKLAHFIECQFIIDIVPGDFWLLFRTVCARKVKSWEYDFYVKKLTCLQTLEFERSVVISQYRRYGHSELLFGVDRYLEQNQGVIYLSVDSGASWSKLRTPVNNHRLCTTLDGRYIFWNANDSSLYFRDFG